MTANNPQMQETDESSTVETPTDNRDVDGLTQIIDTTHAVDVTRTKAKAIPSDGGPLVKFNLSGDSTTVQLMLDASTAREVARGLTEQAERAEALAEKADT